LVPLRFEKKPNELIKTKISTQILLICISNIVYHNNFFVRFVYFAFCVLDNLLCVSNTKVSQAINQSKQHNNFYINKSKILNFITILYYKITDRKKFEISNQFNHQQKFLIFLKRFCYCIKFSYVYIINIRKIFTIVAIYEKKIERQI
ncbi:hypothetical protein RFI_21202, partial [Reticulomyxa filosa]